MKAMSAASISQLVGLLAVALIFSGCATTRTYMGDRGYDALDCVAAYGGIGYPPIVNAGVEVTPLLPVGVGFLSGPDWQALSIGILGRRTGQFGLGVIDFPFNIVLWKHPMSGWERELYLGGTRYADPPPVAWNKRRWGRVGGHAAIFPYHVGFHIECIEIADFLLGWTTVDFCRDDKASARLEDPPEPGQSERSTGRSPPTG
jgi:hypothetical protein